MISSGSTNAVIVRISKNVCTDMYNIENVFIRYFTIHISPIGIHISLIGKAQIWILNFPDWESPGLVTQIIVHKEKLLWPIIRECLCFLSWNLVWRLVVSIVWLLLNLRSVVQMSRSLCFLSSTIRRIVWAIVLTPASPSA